MCFYEVGYFSYILSYLNKHDTKHTVHWIKERVRRQVPTFCVKLLRRRILVPEFHQNRLEDEE